ncbi:MAG TPA: FAD-dependent oxidoreductase, partial [Nitrospirota bacterium]
MTQYKFDVVIVGAGPAGVAAAGALAGTGVSVALLEAGVYAGAENWSGCVYFTECLAEKECFGSEAVEAAPFERRVVRRGTLMHNGLDVVGVELTDPGVFKNCYTVLRPVYDPYFAHLARSKGAALLAGTTVTSLIRKDERVIGVETNRGPLYADITFIAEGDASHLVRSERLERVPAPHFFQGVKAVLSLQPNVIEERFRLNPGEGAAYELLVRNASIGGRTAKLNVGGFLYTNRDSLSLGYVAPLDNIRNNYRGGHDALFEWLRSLPYIKDLTDGAPLSAYGAKIIRSGGWRERPVLVEDGLVVGGASAGLGVDIPFPNFTGPASATGLYFARAARNILKRGRTPDAKNLAKEYVGPLRESVYGKNAQYLSAWPGYFGRSKVLFGRTVDMACGTARFLSSGSLIETGRFLRGHILSFRGSREIVTDTVRAVSALRLWKPIAAATINAATFWQWFANIFKKTPQHNEKLGIILRIAGKESDATTLPWPVGALVKRLSPALIQSLEQIYANNGEPAQTKFSRAIRAIVRGMKVTDFIVLPAFGAALFLIALGTAIRDAFRFYILKTPAEKLLAEPVMAYGESLRRTRDLDAVKPGVSLDAKLATNTYRVGSQSHIRTLWPEAVTAHAEMSQAGLWRVCPARVYVYDAPLFGRGKVTVNFENCIKCESCWRAEPDRVFWGRHTDHKLVYRPESAAIPALLSALQTDSPVEKTISGEISVVDEELWHLSDELICACRAALSASAAFGDSITKLPASADAGRRAWPLALGKRLSENLSRLEAALLNDGRQGPARTIQADGKDFELRLTEGRLSHALYSSRRLGRRINAWIDRAQHQMPFSVKRNEEGLSAEKVSKLFPDRIVKEWEEKPLPEEWAEKLRAFVAEHQDAPQETVRVLSFVSPALGLIAARQFSALRTLAKTGAAAETGICVAASDSLNIEESGGTVRIRGRLSLVPIAASRALLVISRGKGHRIPLSTQGVTATPTPAIGFRAAGLSDIALDCAVKENEIISVDQESAPDSAFYLAIALGAGDYLSKRVKEHAVGRVQFPGQMLDTEGRDGIAKLGAVKAMIGRIEAWRLLLETLYDSYSAFRTPRSAFEFDLLCSSLAAMAFGPEPGAMGYDAGQVFGGFAYSEDDLLSRSYRDSSLFRFLVPGYRASARLHAALGSQDPGQAMPALGSLDDVRGEPLGQIASRLTSVMGSCKKLPHKADVALAGNAEAITLGIRGLLVKIERGLNEGKSMEAEAAAAETMLGLAEAAVMKAEVSAGSGAVSPSAVFPVEPSGNRAALDRDYETFCTMPGSPHTSG